MPLSLHVRYVHAKTWPSSERTTGMLGMSRMPGHSGARQWRFCSDWHRHHGFRLEAASLGWLCPDRTDCPDPTKHARPGAKRHSDCINGVRLLRDIIEGM